MKYWRGSVPASLRDIFFCYVTKCGRYAARLLCFTSLEIVYY